MYHAAQSAGCAQKPAEQCLQLRTGGRIGGAVVACGSQGVSEQRDALAAHGFRIGLRRRAVPQHQCQLRAILAIVKRVNLCRIAILQQQVFQHTLRADLIAIGDDCPVR